MDGSLSVNRPSSHRESVCLSISKTIDKLIAGERVIKGHTTRRGGTGVVDSVASGLANWLWGFPEYTD